MQVDCRKTQRGLDMSVLVTLFRRESAVVGDKAPKDKNKQKKIDDKKKATTKSAASSAKSAKK
jgi:hypothetical protein